MPSSYSLVHSGDPESGSKANGYEDGPDAVLVKGGKFEPEEGQEESHRHSWGRKAEYILSMVGYCVGLGNVWRFPYVCIRNGGGAFLIPFFICLTLCGLPLYFLEVSIGQFVSQSPYHVWNLCPLFKGVGVSMNLLSLFIAWYYATILGWTLVYLANSFADPLPWSRCDQWWNTPNCKATGPGSHHRSNASAAAVVATALPSGGVLLNGTYENHTSLLVNGSAGFIDTANSSLASAASMNQSRSASDEFWLNLVLQVSSGVDDIDGFSWRSCLGMTVASVIAFLCVMKGPSSVGKVVYVTATLPYVLITILIIKGLTLEGAMDGVLFYITPDFGKLLNYQTWTEASLQVFYSLGPGYGSLITMASYNKFRNNCMRDAVTLAFLCEGTSVFAGLATFTMLGHMSHSLDVPIANFSKSGTGLVFVVYPEAISYLPVPQLWAVLFFLMLFALGLDSQFMMLETVLTTIQDIWPSLTGKKEIVCKLVFLVALYLVSLPFTTRAGIYLFQLADWYVVIIAVFCNGLCELFVLSWIYGSERFLNDIKLMIGKKPPGIFPFFWKFITPAILLVCMIMTLVGYQSPSFEGCVYPSYAIVGGWLFAFTSFLPVPLYMVYKLFMAKGTLTERLRSSCQPTEAWKPSPSAPEHVKADYTMESKKWPLCPISLPVCRRT